MRILHIVDQFHVGGIGNLVLDLYRYSRHWHEAFGNVVPGAMADEMRKAGMKVWEGWPPDSEKFDLWVSYTSGAWASDGIALEAHRRGIKCVEHMVSNGHSPTSPTAIDGFIAPNCSLSLPNNDAMPNKVVLYDPVAHWTFPTLTTNRYIGKVCRVVPEKAPDVFIEVSKQVSESEFALVGDGNMMDGIRRNAGANVTLTGRLDTQLDTLKVMSEMRLLLNPTRDDSYGRTVAQAMCMGIPIICQDTLAMRETTHGYAVFCNTLDEFVTAVRAFNADPTPNYALSLKAQVYAHGMYGHTAFRAHDDYFAQFVKGD